MKRFLSAILKVQCDELLCDGKGSGGFDMRHAPQEKEDGSVSEMAIVNTFTKLIFGDEAYTACELSIIEAFQVMDTTVSGDDRKEMGEYLRNLGVREMIQLVSGLRQTLSDCANRLPRSNLRKAQHSTRLV
jgi:hypothetical protein